MNGALEIKWLGEFDELADTREGAVSEESIKRMRATCEGDQDKQFVLVKFLITERRMKPCDTTSATVGLHRDYLSKVRSMAASSHVARANRIAADMIV